MDPTDLLSLQFLDGLGTVGTWALLGFCLIFDKGIAPKSAVKTRDETIAWLRETNAELMIQNRDLVIGTKVATDAFEKVTSAAVSGNGDSS